MVKDGSEKEEEEEPTGVWKNRKEIRRKCDQAKERWLKERCDEIERLSHLDENMMYSRIKQLTGGPRNRSGIVIKKRDGEVAVGIEEVKQRW